MLHSIAAGLWEYSLDGSFGIFTIAASVCGHCLIFNRQIIIFFSDFAPGVRLLRLKCGQLMFWTIPM